MIPARPLPTYLVQRYAGWRATTWAENRSWYRRLAEDGQHPRAQGRQRPHGRSGRL